MSKKIAKSENSNFQDEHQEKGPLNAIKSTAKGVGGVVSRGAEKVASIVLEQTSSGAKSKIKRVLKESSKMTSESLNKIKKEFNSFSRQNLLKRFYFQLGYSLKKSRDVCREIFHDLME